MARALARDRRTSPPLLSLNPQTRTKTKQSLLETFNVLRYHEVMARIDGRLGPDYLIDELSFFSG